MIMYLNIEKYFPFIKNAAWMFLQVLRLINLSNYLILRGLNGNIVHKKAVK